MLCIKMRLLRKHGIRNECRLKENENAYAAWHNRVEERIGSLLASVSAYAPAARLESKRLLG